MEKHYLYTYVPKDNTVDRDGLLSTYASHGKLSRKAMSRGQGWTKYRARAVKHGYPGTFKGVCKWLDDTMPGFRRSKAVSVLTEPVGEHSNKKLDSFMQDRRLYRISPASALLAAGIINNVARLQTYEDTTFGMDKLNYDKIDWSKSDGSGDGNAFNMIPRYMLETVDGHIPPEYVEEVK